LSEAQLSDWVDPGRLSGLLARPTGLTEVVVGESIPFVDQTGARRSFAGARRRGKLFCTVELFEAGGMRWRRQGRQVLIEDDTRQYLAECRELRGHPLVEMQPVLDFFARKDS